jgi:hypothetical protein
MTGAGQGRARNASSPERRRPPGVTDDRLQPNHKTILVELGEQLDHGS